MRAAQPLIEPTSVTVAIDHRVPGGSNFLPILMSFMVGLGAVAFGFHIGLSGPTNNYILAKLQVSKALRDFCFSVICVGAMIGSFLAGSLSDRWGRRCALMFSLVPFAVGVAICVYSLTVAGM